MVIVDSATKGLAAMTLAIAHAYGVFATGGHELGLRPETLDLLAAPAIPATRGFFDECLKGEVRGALGFADPRASVGYAYVTSQATTRLTGDPRDVALRDALYSAIPASSGALGHERRTA